MKYFTKTARTNFNGVKKQHQTKSTELTPLVTKDHTQKPSTTKSTAPTQKPSAYTSAKKRNTNLDSLIKRRNAAKKGTVEHAVSQNRINKAYGNKKVHKVTREVANNYRKKRGWAIKKSTTPTQKPSTTKSTAPTQKPSAYTSAKKRNTNLDSLIKRRNAAKKGTAAYGAVQNKINAAYGVRKRHQTTGGSIQSSKTSKIPSSVGKKTSTLGSSLVATQKGRLKARVAKITA